MSKRFAIIASMLVVAIASTLAVEGKVLAQQGARVGSPLVPQILTNPDDPLWERVPPADLPLLPQAAIQPSLAAVSVSSLKVRSVHDDASVAFLLEWRDATRDVSASRQDSFRDAAAIQFPTTAALPAICMGVRGQAVNIWHWKGDWQEDIDRGFQDVVDAFPNFYKDTYPGVNIRTGTPPFRMPEDFDRPEARQFIVGWSAGNPLSQPARISPVEDLTAIGFGTVTHKAQQAVGGRGIWRDGVWRVVFVRALNVDDGSAAPLAAGADIPVAFAVWNGANQEVGARKQLSTFLSVSLQGPQGPLAWLPDPAVLVALAALLLFVTIIGLRFVLPRMRRAT